MTTYTYPKKEDLEMVVGDEKQEDFFPRMKIKRWANEVNFSIGIISEHKGSETSISDKVEWDDRRGTKARFYEKGKDEFEFEIELASKPKSNVIRLSIETKGLNFFYQPELTEQEIVGGCSRPENVVGSYAVYHKTMSGNYLGGNNYRAGKAFHIYRPYAVDAKGTKVWCDMHIDTEMHITIPQDFLDKAVYPIVVDPTFGHNPASHGASSASSAGWRFNGVYYTSPNDTDTAQSISVYIDTIYTNGDEIKGIVVLSSNKNIIANGVGASTGAINSTGYKTSVFGTDPTVAASTSYLLSYILNESNYVGISYDFLVSSGWVDNSNSFTTPTNPTDGSSDFKQWSVYCTYTATIPTGIARSKINGGLAGRGLINGGLIS